MTVFRSVNPDFTLDSNSFLLWIGKPFLFLLFLYFISTPIDLIYVHALLFKIKPNNFISTITFFISFLIFQKIHIINSYFYPTLFILLCLITSAIQSINLAASLGFIAFFAFNYVFYFTTTYHLFFFIPAKRILKIYFSAFFCTGIYAFTQLLLSLFGVILPGVTQYIFALARGQAFAQEPSYYALYMTPFAMFYNTVYLMKPNSERKFRDIFWPNFFLLVSTSTGCFFTYLFFLFMLVLFHSLDLLKLSVSKLFIKFSVISATIFGVCWLTYKELIITGFLKFFYTGITVHHSVTGRWASLVDYWNIFLEHPLIGIGLGSGPSYLLKKQNSETFNLLDPELFSDYAPSNVTTEILASMGILGGFGFLFLFYSLIKNFRSTLKIKTITEEERRNLIGLAISLCTTLFTLQFNQSIMRAYLWVHFGISVGYMMYLKKRPSLLNLSQ